MLRTMVSIALAAATLIFTSSSTALAAKTLDGPSVAAKEPERFAFIVGNAHYQRRNSTFDDLPDACVEATDFRKHLLSLGWAADHIFPLVKEPEPGDTPEDAIRKVVCDRTSHTIQRDFINFTSMMLANQNNPYGVVFYAGHGVQNNDEFYAFGVDAKVDFDNEFDLLTQTTDYEIFSRPSLPDEDGPTGVNLTRLASAVNGPKGKALLMIVDACRDNALLDTFIAKHQTPSTLSPEAQLRLSISYINSRPDKYDAMFRNIMILFAGRPRRPVLSGTARDPNWFSTNLFAYMDVAANAQTAAPAFVSDFETRAKRIQGGLPLEIRQIPQHIGSMASRPAFCLVGCAQPLSDWSNERVELIADVAVRVPVRVAANGDIRRFQGTQSRTAYTNVSYLLPAARRYVPLQSSPAQNINATPPQRGVAAVPINLDVFYCSGDVNEASRKDAARAFAVAIKRDYPRTLLIAGTYIDQVRLRSLDINDNLAMNRPKTGTSLVLVKSSSASRAWQDRLGTGFDQSYMDDVTKGYFRAYFCTGFSSTQKPRPTVYAQVAHRSEVPQAKAYLSELSTAILDAKFIQIVEPVDDTHPGVSHAPDHTQLRCYTRDSCNVAQSIASTLQTRLSAPVMVSQRVRVTATSTRNPIIELWFGKDVLAGWSQTPLPN